MKDTTKNFLNDLKKIGFDTTNLESQLNANTPVANAADNLFHGGITRLPEFTKIINEKRQLETQIAQGHDKLDSGNLSATDRANLLNHIVALENLIIEEYGADRNEVESLSVEQKKILTPTNTPNQNPTPTIPNSSTNLEVNAMDENKVKEMIQGGMAQMGLGSTMLNINILATMNQFQQLYGRAPNQQELVAFSTAFQREVQSGNENAVSVAGEEAFKFTDKQTEINTASLAAQILAAKAEGAAEALKNAGVVGMPKVPNGQIPISPVFARRVSANTANNTSANTPNPPVQNPPAVGVNNPTNPNGLQLNSNGVDARHAHLADERGLFPYQKRGTQATRVASAVDFAEQNGINLYDQYGMGDMFNKTNPQQ